MRTILWLPLIAVSAGIGCAKAQDEWHRPVGSAQAVKYPATSTPAVARANPDVQGQAPAQELSPDHAPTARPNITERPSSEDTAPTPSPTVTVNTPPPPTVGQTPTAGVGGTSTINMPKPRPFGSGPLQRPTTSSGGEVSHLPEGPAVPPTPSSPPTVAITPAGEPSPLPTNSATISPRPQVSTPSGSTNNSPPGSAPSSATTIFPLLWSGKHKDAAQWTSFTTDIIDKDLAAKLLPGTKDILDFCPRYLVLSRHEKINFWAFLISAIVEKESSFDPTNRSAESFSAPDRVTGMPVHSEGLTQVSYGDMLIYPNDCSFDWKFDLNLHEKSPYKTIFDYERNLRCGAGILAHQVSKHKILALKILPGTQSNAYFKVLWPATRKLALIQTKTKALPFCSL